MVYSGKLFMGSSVLDVAVALQFDSAQDFGLEISNLDDTPADLTGSTAWLIVDNDGTELRLDASTPIGDTWMWHIDREDAQWEFEKRPVVLYVSLGGVDRVWGRGEVRVQR